MGKRKRRKVNTPGYSQDALLRGATRGISEWHGPLALSKCKGHGTPTLVYQSPVDVWAGSRNTTVPRNCIIVDLMGELSSPIALYNWPRVDTFTRPTAVIDWPDMDIPRLQKDEWVDLCKELCATARETGKSLFVSCSAGHGRTGTFLAIWGLLWSSIEDTDCVKWVRDHYCEEAVETHSQIEFIERMTGAKTREHGSLAFVQQTWDGNYTPTSIERKYTIHPDGTVSYPLNPTLPVECETCGGHHSGDKCALEAWRRERGKSQ